MIRKARPADLNDIVRIARQSFQDDGIKVDHSPVDAAIIRAGNCLVGVDRKDHVVAYATFLRGLGNKCHRFYLYEIGTDPQTYRQGFAAQLISSVHRYVPSAGIDMEDKDILALVKSRWKRAFHRESTCQFLESLTSRELADISNLGVARDPELRYAINAFMEHGRLVVIKRKKEIVAVLGLFGDLQGEKINCGFFLPDDGNRLEREARINHPPRQMTTRSLPKKSMQVTTEPDNISMLSMLFKFGFRINRYAHSYPLLGSHGMRFVLQHEDIVGMTKNEIPLTGRVAGKTGARRLNARQLNQIEGLLKSGWEVVWVNDHGDFFLNRKNA